MSGRRHAGWFVRVSVSRGLPMEKFRKKWIQSCSHGRPTVPRCNGVLHFKSDLSETWRRKPIPATPLSVVEDCKLSVGNLHWTFGTMRSMHCEYHSDTTGKATKSPSVIIVKYRASRREQRAVLYLCLPVLSQNCFSMWNKTGDF